MVARAGLRTAHFGVLLRKGLLMALEYNLAPLLLLIWVKGVFEPPFTLLFFRWTVQRGSTCAGHVLLFHSQAAGAPLWPVSTWTCYGVVHCLRSVALLA